MVLYFGLQYWVETAILLAMNGANAIIVVAGLLNDTIMILLSIKIIFWRCLIPVLFVLVCCIVNEFRQNMDFVNLSCLDVPFWGHGIVNHNKHFWFIGLKLTWY